MYSCPRYTNFDDYLTCIPQASENLGMAMIYTLVQSAKEWLTEIYSQDADIDNTAEEEAQKDDVWLFVLSLGYYGYIWTKFKYIYMFYIQASQANNSCKIPNSVRAIISEF